MLQLCQTISAHPNKGTDLCWDHYWKHRTQHAALCPDVLMPSYIQSQGVKSTALDHFQQFESKAPSFHYWAGRRDAVASWGCSADAWCELWQARGRCWLPHCQVLHGGCAWSNSPLT